MALGWFAADRPWNFPLSAYTAGWLGHTSGAWARSASALVQIFSLPFRIGVLTLELGAAAAVANARLLRWWLALAMIFHAIVFALTGFWFLSWIALEAPLFIVLSRRSLRPWVTQNATWAHGLLAASVVIIAGSRMFQPPRLAWFDSPVSYGYELEGIGMNGAEYHVPHDAAAPFAQELSFLRLHLASTSEATAAYGAAGSRDHSDALHAIDSLEKLADFERRLPVPPLAPGSPSERLIVALLEHINRNRPMPWFMLPPPTHFWNSRPAPVYSYREPLSRLDVMRVTALHLDDRQLYRRELVLRVERGEDGRAHVTERAAR